MWTRKDIKEKARAAFKKNYWMCVLVSIIVGLIAGATASVNMSSQAGQQSGGYGYGMDPGTAFAIAGIASIIVGVSFLISILVGNPIKVGGARFFIANDSEPAELGELLFPFRTNYGLAVLTMFLRGLFVFGWTMLFIVPGIIKNYSYRMVPYILAENPDMSATEVITKSREMMDGNKWDAFLLDLSFIGWIFLGVLTLGLGLIFWTNPYIQQTDAELYLAISGQGSSAGYGSYDSYNSLPGDRPTGYDGRSSGYDNYEPIDPIEPIEPMTPLD